MYFPDLTPYAYLSKVELTGVLNIGWLDKTHAYVQGTPPERFASSLKQWLIESKANQMRGYHPRCFCPPSKELSPTTTVGDRVVNLGSAEIWIPSPTGMIFAAPNLIVHYVEEHRYLPPKAFIDAVFESKSSTWNAERAAKEMIRKGFEA